MNDFQNVEILLAEDSSADAEMTLADKTKVKGKALSLGVSDGRAFVGVGGSDPDRVGFELLGLDLGLVMFDTPSVADSSWTALSASADSIGFVGIDGFTLMAQGISLAPGPIFSATRRFGNCTRLNYGHPWSAQSEQAMAVLGRIIDSF